MKKIQGFTLVEMMVVVGLMGITALTSMYLSQQQLGISSKTNKQIAVEQIHQNMEKLIQTEEFCKLNLEGVKIDPRKEVFNFEEIIGEDNEIYLEVGKRTQGVEVNSIILTLDEFDPKGLTGRYYLETTYKTSKATSIVKTIPITLIQSSNNAVKSCLTYSNEDLLMARILNCEDLGGTFKDNRCHYTGPVVRYHNKCMNRNAGLLRYNPVSKRGEICEGNQWIPFQVQATAETVRYCQSEGGIIQQDGLEIFCKFNQSTCPNGWTQFKNWSETENIKVECSIPDMLEQYKCMDKQFDIKLSGEKHELETGEHAWADQKIESLVYFQPIGKLPSQETTKHWACKNMKSEYVKTFNKVWCLGKSKDPFMLIISGQGNDPIGNKASKDIAFQIPFETKTLFSQVKSIGCFR